MGRLIGKIQLSLFVVTFLSISALAGGSIAGKVTIVKGQVFIIRGSEKIQVKKDITVLESDVIESQGGGTARITMIDSNLVDVYPKSKVEIAKYVYKPNEDKKDVELKVDFGKIKSTVNQKYDGAKNKYQVKTPSAVAGVRGTVFTTEYDAAKKVSRVTTIEGLVAVTKLLDRGERQAPPVFVRPNQEVKLDAESAKAEQPRDLKSEERNERKKEDSDLGYQYDPKAEPAKDISETAANSAQPPKEIQLPKEASRPPKSDDGSFADRANGRGIGVERREERKEMREELKERFKEARERLNEEKQEQQERRQTASEDEQAKKQKQLEDEQAKKQKQLEDEQAKKQKQLEDEQAKKQKQLEEEQVKKQKQLEEEQVKKQKQLEEEQAKKQKHLEEEQAKKQRLIEELLAAKRKHAEEAQAKREEEQKKRAEEDAQRRAELARRLAEIAKRAEEINRLPSGSSGSTPTTTLPGSILPIEK